LSVVPIPVLLMGKRYGTMESYFSGALAIDAVGQIALRGLYLEKT